MAAVMAKAMRTIVVAASKGGAGKTTLASALAVRASAESGLVAIIDLDPQGSLARWWELRGEPKNPRLVTGVERVDEAVSLLQRDGWEWLIVDTPPCLLATIEQAIRVADLVLVPVRPSALDVEAAPPMVELCRMHGRALRFVINGADPRSKLTQSTVAYLAKEGRVLPEMISYRQAYVAGMTDGKSGPEIEREAKSRQEIDALWRAVKKVAISKAAVR